MTDLFSSFRGVRHALHAFPVPLQVNDRSSIQAEEWIAADVEDVDVAVFSEPLTIDELNDVRSSLESALAQSQDGPQLAPAYAILGDQTAGACFVHSFSVAQQLFRLIHCCAGAMTVLVYLRLTPQANHVCLIQTIRCKCLIHVHMLLYSQVLKSFLTQLSLRCVLVLVYFATSA